MARHVPSRQVISGKGYKKSTVPPLRLQLCSSSQPSHSTSHCTRGMRPAGSHSQLNRNHRPQATGRSITRDFRKPSDRNLQERFPRAMEAKVHHSVATGLSKKRSRSF